MQCEEKWNAARSTRWYYYSTSHVQYNCVERHSTDKKPLARSTSSVCNCRFSRASSFFSMASPSLSVLSITWMSCSINLTGSLPWRLSIASLSHCRVCQSTSYTQFITYYQHDCPEGKMLVLLELIFHCDNQGEIWKGRRHHKSTTACQIHLDQ